MQNLPHFLTSQFGAIVSSIALWMTTAALARPSVGIRCGRRQPSLLNTPNRFREPISIRA